MEKQENSSELNQIHMITSMIAEARKSFSKTSIYFLIWGIVMAVAGLVEFWLTQEQYASPFIAWPVAGAIGGIWAGVVGRKQGMQQTHFTLYDRAIMAIWSSYTVTLVLIIIASVLQKQNPGLWIMFLTGLPTLASGLLIKFRPLIYGGIVFWVAGLIALFIPSNYLPLTFAISLFFGYIIPGLMLKRAEENGSL
ncbi:hypothetical protein [Luteibaculum oceani]|uniref:Uncharacterized protein n=1 Tax=Luteibaculum oceani TaxID=1294296 RepID=A0A5C6V1Q8_9FLAO|nr:hypothetical protein [Luteibaculum oceani]TXC76925.1 hypothetical protein FRX97_09925 [Luteibaculum oceani]